jgi:hypothetical protein
METPSTSARSRSAACSLSVRRSVMDTPKWYWFDTAPNRRSAPLGRDPTPAHKFAHRRGSMIRRRQQRIVRRGRDRRAHTAARPAPRRCVADDRWWLSVAAVQATFPQLRCNVTVRWSIRGHIILNGAAHAITWGRPVGVGASSALFARCWHSLGRTASSSPVTSGGASSGWFVVSGLLGCCLAASTS